MRDLAEWWGHVSGLLRETARVWWRCLPRLVAAYVLGLTGQRLAVYLAAFLGRDHPWLSLVVLAVGLVSMLSGLIVCLRIVGNQLGIREVLPEGAADDDRDQSIPRLLAITLLPFLGIYATFGQIQALAREVFDYEMLLHGTQSSALAKLNPDTLHTSLVVAGVVVVTYLVRRGLDLAHERTDIRVLGLAAALCEGFFMLVLVETGSRLITRGWQWLQGRVVGGWASSLNAGLHTSLRRIASFLPEALDRAWQFVAGTLWPLLTDAVFQPLLWLAVAALVYGSHVLSLAEMWRKGEPLSARLDERRTVALARARRRREATGWGRRAALEVQEAFFGDVDDKYLPTLQSIRIVLHMGLLFLGAFVLCHAVVEAVGNALVWLVAVLLGGHTTTFWVQWSPLVDELASVVQQPLQLSLLATALVSVLRSLRDGRAPTVEHAAAEPVAGAPALAEPAVAP